MLSLKRLHQTSRVQKFQLLSFADKTTIIIKTTYKGNNCVLQIICPKIQKVKFTVCLFNLTQSHEDLLSSWNSSTIFDLSTKRKRVVSFARSWACSLSGRAPLPPVKEQAITGIYHEKEWNILVTP
jgi:hypothetical protein